MTRLLAFWKSIFDKLNAFFGFPVLDADEKIKRMLAISGASVVAPVLLAFGFLHLFRGDSFLAWFLVLSGIIFSISLLIIPKIQKVVHLIRIDLGLAGVLFIYLLATSGPDGHMAVWLYVYPTAVFFMLRIREGLILSTLLLMVSSFVLIFQETLLNLTPIDPGFSIRFFISLFLVTFIAFFYELARSKYLREFGRNQLKLEEEKQNLAAAKIMAEKASRAKSEFLANMSHELRTPLNHILGFTELVANKQCGDLNPEQEEYLKDVLHSSQHLLSLINDILDLSKAEAGKLELEVSDLDLRVLLENSLNMVREKALKHRIQLMTSFNGLPEVIQADDRKLKQILYNLLSNAVKFTPDGGSVRLSARLISDFGFRNSELKKEAEDSAIRIRQSAIEISVEDTGIGIQGEDLRRIFDPFEQVESSASRRYEGTGLGLSLTKRLVELHGGTIWAESEGLRKGSKFTFSIPV